MLFRASVALFKIEVKSESSPFKASAISFFARLAFVIASSEFGSPWAWARNCPISADKASNFFRFSSLCFSVKAREVIVRLDSAVTPSFFTRPDWLWGKDSVEKSTAFNSFEGCDSFTVSRADSLAWYWLWTPTEALSDRLLFSWFCVPRDSLELAVTLWLFAKDWLVEADWLIDWLILDELEALMDWLVEADWLALCEFNSDNDWLWLVDRDKLAVSWWSWVVPSTTESLVAKVSFDSTVFSTATASLA